MCRRAGKSSLEWLDCRGHENQLIELQCLAGIAGREQVADVRWIKASAKDPEPHGSRDCGSRRRRGSVGNAVAHRFDGSIVDVLLPKLGTKIRRVLSMANCLVRFA